MIEYEKFLETKAFVMEESGFEVERINEKLFQFQKDIVRWALKKGKACIFAGTGLGKTFMQVEWAKHVHQHTKKPILIVAPLAVASQTVEEANKIGVSITYAEDQTVVSNGIFITNYERLDKFDLSAFSGIVLDESSILKAYAGKIRDQIIEGCQTVPFRLACSATPSPNDYMELGNHCEFCGVMSYNQMLAEYFVHDGGDTSKWRIKGHAKTAFWEFVASWAVMLSHPSDLGYSDEGYILPPIRYHEYKVTPDSSWFQGRGNAKTLTERRQARKESFDIRCKKAADIVNAEPGVSWLVWCDLNSESECLTKMINDAVEIRGSHSQEYKRDNMIAFSEGINRVLVTKPSIAGFGMNWQHCNKMIFVGLSDSFEAYYQAVRRSWRFGQAKEVDVHVVTSTYEGEVVKNIKRKERDFEEMIRNMVSATQEITKQNLVSTGRIENEYKEDTFTSENTTLYMGDCVEQAKKIPDNSIHFSVFSPPFSSLYTYSNSSRDMGNCKTDDEFMGHMAYLADELYRILMPGRNMAVHCFDIPAMKQKEGFIGLKDFPGMLIRLFESRGFIFHSRFTIWKDPVTAMQRTKALGLLHKQIKKDSAMSRTGIPDYIIVMRKPGENPEPITHTNESFPVSKWQEYASPIWMDINPSCTLQRFSAREDDDERHICPLQLDVIERCIELWSNPGDIVFTPFMGIGSEVYQAVIMGRRGIGIELKESYFYQACANITKGEKELKTPQVALTTFF